MAEQDEAKVIELHPSTLTDGEISADVWIDRYARLHGIEYHYKTHSVRQDGETIDPALFIAQMRLMTHRLDLSGIKKMLPDGFLVWRKRQAQLYLATLREQLRFAPSEQDLIAQWIEAVTGAKDELDIAVARHFIWQVKRKLFGLPVDFHLMIVLVGKSGGGKSVAVHKLIGPLIEVTSFRDLRIFNDQFARRAFNRSFIIHFDELARSQDADINALKDVITASTIDWRGIGSETIHSAVQNSTFIGCSNLPVRERIQDPTSSRRFWQLDCADQLSWETINVIDYFALWKSIDENGPCPLLPVLNEIRVRQEQTLQHRDVIEDWLDYGCEAEPFGPDSPSTETLFADFNAWCTWRQICDSPGPQTFARGLSLRLKRLGWSASSKRSHRGTIWSLKIKNPPPPDPVIKPIHGLAASFESVAVSVDSETTENEEEK